MSSCSCCWTKYFCSKLFILTLVESISPSLDVILACSIPEWSFLSDCNGCLYSTTINASLTYRVDCQGVPYASILYSTLYKGCSFQIALAEHGGLTSFLQPIAQSSLQFPVLQNDAIFCAALTITLYLLNYFFVI